MGAASWVGTRIQTLLALALLGCLLVMAFFLGEPTTPVPFDLNSPAADGLRALRLWLGEMGYQVMSERQPTFAVPPDLDLLFIYPNQEPYTEAEAKTLADWVAQGHTLVIVGLTFADVQLQTTFQVRLDAGQPDLAWLLAQQQPLLPDAPMTQAGTGAAQVLNLTEAPAAVAVWATQKGEVTAAVQQFGKGVVWHLSLHHALTNEQLREPAQAMLTPALLRHVPEGGKIAFDTYHLFGPMSTTETAAIQSLQDWLYRTPTGWATLLTVGLVLFYFVQQGRRLGPSLPAQAEVRRREAAEYVIALANLLRRARQRAVVAQHHKQRFKRTIGRLLQISPDLEDAAFMQRLQEADPRWNAEEQQQIAVVLQTLNETANERKLVQTVAEMDKLLEKSCKRVAGSRWQVKS